MRLWIQEDARAFEIVDHRLLVFGFPPAGADNVEVVHIFHAIFFQVPFLNAFAVVSNHHKGDESASVGGKAPAVIVKDGVPSDMFECFVHLSLGFEYVAAAIDWKLFQESLSLITVQVFVTQTAGGGVRRSA